MRLAQCKIAIGADHGGYALKEQLKGWLAARGCEVLDHGTHDGQSCDYPDVAAAVARSVAAGRSRRGIVIDGAGIGSSMAANKVAGVRAALCYDVSSARNSREHNDANVLTLGARLVGPGLAEQIVETFLSTDCTEERHLRRVAMIGALEGSPACGCAAEGAGQPRPGTPPHKVVADAPPPAHSRDASAPVEAFRAGAASWLGRDGHASMNQPDKLSPDDQQRVLTRIAELLSGGGAPGVGASGGKWCLGDVCIDLAVARQWVAAGVERLSSQLGNGHGVREIAKYIDHTLLKPDACRDNVLALTAEAREHGFASVCINPTWVSLAARALMGSEVKVCTVVGFPLGATMADIKAMEARRAIREGAREIDMVINIGALKSGDDDGVFRDIRAVVDACEDGRALCKVIIETALLTDEEKVRACVLARKARADFVKTSTGFSTGGATAADVALMSRVVAGARMGVKASGGVRDLADFEKMVQAGATRIGASAGVKILKEAS